MRLVVTWIPAIIISMATVNAFVVPKRRPAALLSVSKTTTTSSLQLQALQTSFLDNTFASLLIADGGGEEALGILDSLDSVGSTSGTDAVTASAAALVQQAGAEPSLMDKFGNALPTIGVVAFAIISFFIGLTYIFASFIVPAAAKEVERQAKELDPALWDAYQDKLGPGETMEQRPDLLQELGNILQEQAAKKLQDPNIPVQTPEEESTFATMSEDGEKKEPNTVSVITPDNEVIDLEVPDGVQVVEAKDGDQWAD